MWEHRREMDFIEKIASRRIRHALTALKQPMLHEFNLVGLA